MLPPDLEKRREKISDGDKEGGEEDKWGEERETRHPIKEAIGVVE